MKILKDKKIVISLWLLSLLLFTNVKVYSAPTFSVPAENLEEAKQAVWRMQNNNVNGTGFFISPTLFVTNFHVIGHFINENSLNNPPEPSLPVDSGTAENFINENSLDEVYLTQENSHQKLKIKKVLALSISPDLALLETEPHNSFYLKLKESPLHPEEDLSVVGYPGGSFYIEKNLSLIKKVEDSFLFSFSHPDFKGGSGSPVLNSDGEVLGVNYLIFKETHFSITTSRDSLNSFLEENKTTPPCKKLNLSKCVSLAWEDAHKKAIQEGDFLYQYFLSLLYLNGWLVEKNEETAFYLMKLAAEQGYMVAQRDLALMYHHGQGIKQDNKASVYWLKQSAGQGFAPAQYILSKMYSNGIGVEQNEKFAFYWMKLAAENGSERAQFELAVMYFHGMGVPENKKLAFYWTKQAAEQGYVLAQFFLAGLYSIGIGVPVNKELAFYWMKLAAEQGYVLAQFELANMYFHGIGVPVNKGLAFYWEEKAIVNQFMEKLTDGNSPW